MKKHGALLGVVLVFCFAFPLGMIARGEATISSRLTPIEQLVDAAGQVIFTDATVEAAIRLALAIPDGPITAKQLGKLGAKKEELLITVPSPATLDLSVLQLCVKLKNLSLDGVTPADPGAISALKSLQYLFIRNAAISDYSFLASCKKLAALWIGGSPCRNISFVSDLPKLSNFHIDSRVPDLSPLYASKKIVAVSIGQATDAEVNTLLDNMGKRLTSLGLKGCPVTDATLERIAGLKLLDVLVGGVPLANIAPLWQSKTIRDIKLFNLQTKVLEGIQDLKTLKVLSLENMEGTLDLSLLSALPKLGQLHLDGVTLSTLSGIESLTALTELTLVRVSGIKDFTPLCGLAKLKALYTDMPERMPEGLPLQ